MAVERCDKPVSLYQNNGIDDNHRACRCHGHIECQQTTQPWCFQEDAHASRRFVIDAAFDG